MEKLMTISEVSQATRQPVETLRWWRQQGRGPKDHKVGRRLLYRERDVQSWLDEQMPTGTNGDNAHS